MEERDVDTQLGTAELLSERPGHLLGYHRRVLPCHPCGNASPSSFLIQTNFQVRFESTIFPQLFELPIPATLVPS